MTGFAPRLAAPAVALSLALASPALAAEDVVIVYDASGSMWGQIDGTSKVEIARNVMADLVEGWDENTNLGLVAYGHRRQGDCADIETLITPGPVDRAGFIATVNAIRPVGKTPLTESVRQAAELLSWRDNPATVVLISDGLETCNADPCALAAELARQGVDFTAHVVGFDLEDADHASLACIAESTGGLFVPAGNAAELQEALTRVTTAVETPAPEPEPEPEPAPEPEPDLPEVTLRGPEQVTTGAAFEFYWSATIHPRDYITIVPAGADEGTHTSYIRTDKASRGSLVAPATPGLYELRYVQDEGGATLASAPVEVVEAEVSLTGPEQVTTGANFDFNWSNAIHPRDYITIVPAGADEGTHTSYIRVDKNTQGSLVAPSAPGLYELRYVLAEGARTLASVPVEVVEAELGISAPAVMRAGSEVDISWSASIHPRDYITIVPAGADEGTYASYNRVGTGTQTRMTAPAEPGLYEIRYVLAEGARTMAMTPLEVVPANAPLDDGAGLSAPEAAGAGEAITITWEGGGSGGDERIALARKEQPDFSWIAAFKTAAEGEKTMEITMPEEPGFYEIRFLDLAGPAVLGRAIIEVK